MRGRAQNLIARDVDVCAKGADGRVIPASQETKPGSVCANAFNEDEWRCDVEELLTGFRERVGRSPIRALEQGRRACSVVRPRCRVRPRRFLKSCVLDHTGW